MRLFLCEKPSQARDIAAVLGAGRKDEGCLRGDGVAVTWCIGHLLEMAPPEAYDPAYKRWDLSHLPIIPARWKLEVTERGKAQFKAVKAALADASEVVLATDADREGETIGREVLERCGWRGPVRRLWLSALDPASIRKALAKLLPGDKTEPLYRAGLGRARADWLVGMNLSRLYTLLGRQRGLDGVLSVGRVQTPTLKLVVDRDREIEGFKPVAYFVLDAVFRARAGTFRARWQAPAAVSDAEGRCLQREAAAQAARKVHGREGRVTRADTERKSVGPPLPFDLGTLQQEASKRYGMTAQQVLDTAQALYETHKATTYPRTDCPYLPESQFSEASNVLKALAASDPALGPCVAAADTRLRSRAWNDARITAHHAIIPTAATVGITRLSQDEQRLYDLIRRRYLAQFFPDYQYDQTTIEMVVEGETFKASGRVSRVTGWQAVMASLPAEESGDDDDMAAQSLPPVVRGDAATVTDTVIHDRKTKPPPRFTDGTLIAAMKSVGEARARSKAQGDSQGDRGDRHRGHAAGYHRDAAQERVSHAPRQETAFEYRDGACIDRCLARGGDGSRHHRALGANARRHRSGKRRPGGIPDHAIRMGGRINPRGPGERVRDDRERAANHDLPLPCLRPAARKTQGQGGMVLGLLDVSRVPVHLAGCRRKAGDASGQLAPRSQGARCR